MSIKSVFVLLKTLLETEDIFKKQVSIWDYSILDVAAPYALVLKPGMVTQEIDAYGNQWLRKINVTVEVYAFYQPANSTASVNRLLDAIDLIDTLLIDNYHLGSTVDVVQSARIALVGEAQIISRDPGGNKWFRATIVVEATEPEAGGAGAQ